MPDTAYKPLGHLTVIDMTVNVPGPFCSTVLGDLGADVIKIEPPGGDPLRHSPGMWTGINRGKRSVVLDLKTDGGRDVLGRLAQGADIVLEGWRPGVAKRLGADYETLSAKKPKLVYCSISGFGQDGPWSQRPGHDVNYLALSGYMGAQIAVEGRAWAPPILVSDLVSGLYAAIAALAAATGATHSGQGSYIDLSMADSALSLLAPEIGRLTDEESDDVKPNVTFIPHYGVFPCKDGRWFSLGIVHEDHFWDRFCEAAGIAGLAGLTFQERLDRGEEIADAVHAAFLTRTAADWENVLTQADVPAAIVTELHEIFDSPQFQARGMFADLGLGKFLGQPFRLSGQAVGPDSPPPALGEHIDAVLSELDYGLADIEKLRTEGALGPVEAEAAR
jgi:crotonobetainyl-CoA:carnitine CoA-transferase CaiB-like acyl-CoA transferase